MRHLIVAALMVVFSWPALAHDIPCAVRAAVAEILIDKGSAQAEVGMTRAGNLAELWINPETEEWLIFFTTPDGIACKTLGGKHWMPAPQEPKGDKS